MKMKETYYIFGMTCAACSSHVQKAVSSIDGIISCDVSLLTNQMTVEHNGIDSKTIINAVVKAGYKASKESLEDKNNNKLVDKVIISIVLLILLMFLLLFRFLLHLLKNYYYFLELCNLHLCYRVFVSLYSTIQNIYLL